MISVPSAAATQVATNTASFGMPASPRMVGLTKMMYAIVRKVVTPASISVRTSVWCSRSLNRRSSGERRDGAAMADVSLGSERGSGIDMLCLLYRFVPSLAKGKSLPAHWPGEAHVMSYTFVYRCADTDK